MSCYLALILQVILLGYKLVSGRAGPWTQGGPLISSLGTVLLDHTSLMIFPQETIPLFTTPCITQLHGFYTKVQLAHTEIQQNS